MNIEATTTTLYDLHNALEVEARTAANDRLTHAVTRCKCAQGTDEWEAADQAETEAANRYLEACAAQRTLLALIAYDGTTPEAMIARILD